MIQRKLRILVLWMVVLVASGAGAARGAEVNVYSYRQPFLIRPIVRAFEQRTGTRINMVFAKSGLVERLKVEGHNSPADMILTVDVGRLNDAVTAGVLRPVRSTVLSANIPARYRHPDHLWFGLTLRARVVFAAKGRVSPGELSTYEDLALPRWRGRICSRSSSHPYNVALLASMIVHNGEARAERWARGVVANLARKPQGNDRAQARAIKEGVCDVALGNSYYLGKMLEDAEQAQWARAIFPIFPNQDGRGTHVNISGAGITKSAKNLSSAIRLLEYLSGIEAQELYAETNYEYPVNPAAKWSALAESWGRFKSDSVDLTAIANNRAKAIRVYDRAGFP